NIFREVMQPNLDPVWFCTIIIAETLISCGFPLPTSTDTNFFRYHFFKYHPYKYYPDVILANKWYYIFVNISPVNQPYNYSSTPVSSITLSTIL
ncbi:MAG TPA: hypothetical protein VEF33_01490, partial [Syntrophales bacterium]|nr:hypothetical protein [Syntrophales bacterium]